MKKILLYGGAFLGSFLVINVGMYFFLKSTQPKTAITALHESENDSTVTHVELDISDSTAHKDESIVMSHDEAGPPVADVPTETMADAHSSEPEEGMEMETPEIEIEEEPVVLPDEVEEIVGDPKQLAKLAKLMDGMKPVDAAAIASRLPVDVIVSLVMKMKDRNAAKMMASLPIEQAARVAMRMSELATGTVRS